MNIKDLNMPQLYFDHSALNNSSNSPMTTKQESVTNAVNRQALLYTGLILLVGHFLTDLSTNETEILPDVYLQHISSW